MNYGDTPQTVRNFLSYMETIKGKSENTIKEYYYDLRMFFRFLIIHKDLSEDKKFEDIDIKNIKDSFIKTVVLSDLYAFMTYLSRERKISSPSRARKVACLKSFFNYLTKKEKLLKNNPALELDSPKVSKRLPKYLTVDESKMLLNVVNGKHYERDYCILVLFLNCGLRLSELVGIDINKIRNDKLTVIGKGNKERTVYLNLSCIDAIKNYMEVRLKNNVKDRHALFLSERKQRISIKTVQYIVKKYIKAAGLDETRYSVHKLRHTAATLMYKHGKVDIRALQSILGHESVATTEIYTHLDDSQLKKAVESNPLANFKADKDK